MKQVIAHYDNLIDENNDPVRDPKPLREYMDKWDGQKFMESMQLNKSKSVLEIGIGTGRLAMKAAPLCQFLLGIDISFKTIQRASENLSHYRNIKLVCDDFMTFEFADRFDVIYSSLTFMHMEDKLSAIKKIASLLNEEGLFVLSIDKNKSKFIDMGTRKIRIFPDDPVRIGKFIAEANLMLNNQFETDHAYVMVSQRKTSLV